VKACKSTKRFTFLLFELSTDAAILAYSFNDFLFAHVA